MRDHLYATPTEQGRSTVGGPVPPTGDATAAAAARYVHKHATGAEDEARLLDMLGLGPEVTA